MRTRLRRAAVTVDRWDVAASAAIAGAAPPAVLDRALPLLTRTADRSVLWMGVSAVLFGLGNRSARRAAARGLGSIAVTSLLANQLAKRLVPRRRPDLSAVPLRRVAHRVPTSSSFPSGHSASAAAFALGAAIECPPLAAPVGILATAVGFSRIYTGVHFPSDVLAGALLGAGVATVGVVVLPAHREPTSTPTEPSRRQPPRPDGRGVVAVINPESGGGAGRDVIDELRRALPAAEIVALGEDDDPGDVFADAAKRAEVLAVGGGDGTVRTAAHAAIEADVPLLVLPAGTFNHFAKDLGMPEVEDAIAALAAGRAVRVDVGEAEGRLFVNTASLGSYPDFVTRREKLEARLGKPIAAAVALAGVLRNSPAMDVTVDGVRRRLLMLFVGAGEYQPSGLWPRRRERLDSARLDVRYVDAASGRSALGLLAAAVSGGLVRTPRLVQSRPQELLIEIAGDPGKLALDGELGEAPRRVRFMIRKGALTVYRNAPGRGYP